MSGIAVVFDDRNYARLLALQRQVRSILAKYGINLCTPPLDQDNNVPHMTIVQQLHDADCRDLHPILSGVLADIGSYVVASGVVYQKLGWLFLNIELTDAVRCAHQSCAQWCDEAGLFRPWQSDTTTIPFEDELERSMAARYGYRYMYNAYTIPHITLGKMDNVSRFLALQAQIDLEMQDAFDAIFGDDTKVSVSCATHYRMGPFGSHAETLKAVLWDDDMLSHHALR